MKRANLLIKSTTLVMSVMIAGNLISVGAVNNNIFGINSASIINKVHAAEASLFTGEFIYLQNDAKNPNPAVIPQADGSIAIALFNGTSIQLNCAAGIVPKVVTGVDFANVGVSANGIVITPTTVGSGVVQVQDTVTGKTSVIAINVVAGSASAQPATQSTTQIVSAAYSYADNHKVVSSDGLLELNLDAMTYESSTTAFTPKIYYGADGILTMEAWGGQNINIPVLAINKANCEVIGAHQYLHWQPGVNEAFGTTDKDTGIRRVVIGGNRKGDNILYHYSIKQVGKQNVTNATDLPIRVITLESEDVMGTRVPETPIALTTK